MLLRDLFEVFQNTTFEVIDIIDPLAHQIIGGFLAPNAACAKHRNAFIVKAVFVLFPPLGEFTKARRFRIDCTLECADGHFVIIARVNDDDILGLDQVIPLGGLDILANFGLWIDVGLPHGHDLFLQFDLHSRKWGH